MSLDPRLDPSVIAAKAQDEAEQAERPKKPLKHARSQAELTAVRQRKTQILLVATNVIISALIALRTFGII